MGNFYTNITLRGPSQKQAVDILLKKKRVAFVSPTVNGVTTVFDAECEQQDPNVLGALAAELSRELGCPALAILNHDDDILLYKLYEGGVLIDQYDSSPGYFDANAEPSEPKGGDATKLCNVMGVTENIKEIEGILRKSSYDENGFVFAVDRHEALARALGLPDFSVGFGYNYLRAGELPEGVSARQLKHTG